MDGAGKKSMILISITNRACYPCCKTLIDSLGDDCSVMLMNPEKEIEEELYSKIAFVSRSRIYGNGQAMAASTGHYMIEAAMALDKLKPEVVVVVGDRHEVLGMAAAARMANIPVIQLQAGERSGSVDDDIRFAVSNLSGLLIAYHDKAMEELSRKDMAWKSVKAKCPSIDLCLPPYAEVSEISNYGYGDFLGDGPYYLVSLHPDTNATKEENIGYVKEISRDLLSGYYSSYPIVWIAPSMHDAHGEAMNKRVSQELSTRKKWRLIKHVPHRLMISLIRNCIGIIGNSSMMYREAEYFGKTCFEYGSRQSGRVKGSIWEPGGGKEVAGIIREFLSRE
ncbi:MAG: UDP-N-acetylglucosamine 2-epimerase [Rubrobacteraceae bacterium]